tara:strand:- start:2217 stop:2975 length:759 start_codon:yes stop_codon:yes gene_type:complete
MGYLDNSTIVVDAVLTKEGRKKLAQGNGLNIQYFTLSDSGIDYRLWNPDHPSGSAFYGEAIENLPSLEAIPRAEFYMRNKLITLDRGVTGLPYWESGVVGTDTEGWADTEAGLTLDNTTDPETPPNSGNYNGVVRRLTFKQAVPGPCLLVVGNISVLNGLTAVTGEGNTSVVGRDPQSLSTYGTSFNSLVNAGLQEAGYFDLSTTDSSGVFELRFNRAATVAALTTMDATIIDLDTGIFKSFKITVDTKGAA